MQIFKWAHVALYAKFSGGKVKHTLFPQVIHSNDSLNSSTFTQTHENVSGSGQNVNDVQAK